MPPTLAGFLTFIRNGMGIGTAVLPDNSPSIPIAYNVAMAIVNPALQAVGCAPGTPSIYAFAVYNLAGDNLVNYAQDQAGQTFFAELRKSLNLSGFVGGVVQATADQGSSESMVVPDAFKQLTVGNLQNLKTPWGRAYLGFAQDYGFIVGIS